MPAYMAQKFNHVVNHTINETLCGVPVEEPEYDENREMCENCQRLLMLEHIAG